MYLIAVFNNSRSAQGHRKSRGGRLPGTLAGASVPPVKSRGPLETDSCLQSNRASILIAVGQPVAGVAADARGGGNDRLGVEACEELRVREIEAVAIPRDEVRGRRILVEQVRHVHTERGPHLSLESDRLLKEEVGLRVSGRAPEIAATVGKERHVLLIRDGRQRHA